MLVEYYEGIPRWLSGKESACQCGRHQSLGWEDALEEEMATHSSILAWIIPWTEKPLGYNTQGHKESDTTATEFACRVLCGHVILTHYPSKYLVHTVERFSIVLKKGNLSIYAL